MSNCIMSLKNKPLSYQETIDRYDLALLRNGGQLILENGDIARTKWGDLRFGTVAFNGLWRMVQHWRFNAGVVRELFDTTYAMGKELESQRKADKGAGRGEVRFYDMRAVEEHADPPSYVEREKLAALEFGQETYSSCTILFLSNFLQQFRDDVEATDEAWKSSGPLYNGISFGQVVVAAGNGVRHNDEWVKAKLPDKRQANSTRVLETAFGHSLGGGQALRKLPLYTLQALSQLGRFDHMSASMFSFAHQVALTMDAARSSAE
jgi:hypothetical protein